VCLPVYKALANFWIFVQKRKVLAGKLKVDREEHEKRMNKALANFWIFVQKRKVLAGKLKVDREEHEKRMKERIRDEEGNDVGSVNLLLLTLDLIH